jgi:hypothetical protein
MTGVPGFVDVAGVLDRVVRSGGSSPPIHPSARQLGEGGYRFDPARADHLGVVVEEEQEFTP